MGHAISGLARKRARPTYRLQENPPWLVEKQVSCARIAAPPMADGRVNATPAANGIPSPRKLPRPPAHRCLADRRARGAGSHSTRSRARRTMRRGSLAALADLTG